jgi:fermentation-respiration switch protein FrsA (DUF1100 family)
MLRFLVPLVVLVVVVYIGMAIYIYRSQASFVFFPDPELLSNPAKHGLPFRDLTLTTSDSVKLHAWYLPADSSRGVILFCHGNGGNISYVIETLAALHGLGFDVLAFDYRGYGLSEGEPEEEGLYRDADAAWNFLVDERGVDPSSIVLHGRSLGGGVATYLATKHRPAALILESTFTSIPDIGAKIFPYFPIRLLSQIKFETLKRLPGIEAPVLVIHSRDDEMIPFDHGRSLFAAAKEPKEFLEIGGDHNSGFHVSGRKYVEGIGGFLRRWEPSPQPSPRGRGSKE